MSSNKRGREGDDSIWPWNFPEDICFDIFSRLPTKSVMLCRCVCKSWQILTSSSNSDFVNMHLRSSCTPHPNNPDIVFGDSRIWDVPKLTFSIVESYRASNLILKPLLTPLYLTSLRLMGSCNGLLCFANTTNPFRIIYIYNPCTRESTRFPLSSDYQGKFFGFGHDPILDEYKVVTINRKRFGGEVWTLGSELWRRTCDVPFKQMHYMGRSSCVSLDGSLHWISQKREEKEKPLTIGIGSFHVAREGFQFDPLPIEVYDASTEMGHTFFYIGALQGCISVAKLEGIGFDQVEVWATDNYRLQSCWSRLYVIKANLLSQMRLFANWDLLLENEDRVARMGFSRDDLGLQLIAKGTDLGLENIVKITDAFVHVGTLVSPIRGTPASVVNPTLGLAG